MTRQPDVLAGRYRIAAPLPPIGGVPRDLAVDTTTDGQVEVARFARSGDVPRAFGDLAARYLAVRHPCLAPVLVFTEPGADPALDPIVVEQHVDGARLGPGVALPRRQALLVAADVADAIAALHAGRLVHGALGAEAIVLDSAGRAITSGAGAKALQAAALGGAVADAVPSDDLRDLGTLLYALLCGRAPATPPVPPAELVPEIDAPLNGLVLSLLSDDPLRPPPPASAVGLRLRDLAGEPAPSGALVPVRTRSAPVRRNGPRPGTDLALAGAVAVLGLLGVAAAFAVTRTDDDPVAVATTTAIATSTAAPSTAFTLPTVSEPTTIPLVPTLPVTTAPPATVTVATTVEIPGAASIITEPYEGTTVFTSAATTVTYAQATTATITVPVSVTVPPG